MLAGSVLLTIGPQVIAAVRGRDLRGIAPATMWISLCDAALWGLYGITVGDGSLMAYGVVLFTSAVIVLARIGVTELHGATQPALLNGHTATAQQR